VLLSRKGLKEKEFFLCWTYPAVAGLLLFQQSLAVQQQGWW
jgi:hypothetical protein